MNDANRTVESGLVLSVESKAPPLPLNNQLSTLNFPGPAELPPVHPKCRIISGRDILRYGEKMRAAGNGAALGKLGQALMAAYGFSDLSKVFESRRN